MQRLCLCLLASIALASDVTPVQKVVQMLETMKEKGTKEMNEEQVQYAKFEEFCKGTLAEKGASITSAADQIETLEAEIESATSEAARLAEEIGGHAADIEAASKEKQNATELRETTRSDFVATLKDYTESIDAVGRALKVLKAEKKSSSFLELQAVRDLKTLPISAADSLDAYIKGSSLIEAAPEAKTYEFQSGGVISMLEGLQDKFVDERVSLEKEEAKKRHSYEMLVQSLDAQLAQSKKDQDAKVQFKAKKLQAKASAEGDLDETKTEKASDEKYAKDLKATCSKKAAAFDERQKLRKEELEALTKAQDIISSGAVAGSAEKHLPGLVQTATSLAFLRSFSARPEQLEQVTRFLQQRAESLKSRVLSATAERAAADPIAKVKTMIEQLIVKMQDQANEEATKHGWCQAELASNKAMREEKTDQVDSLQSEIEELSSSIAKLGEEAVTLNEELTQLTTAMANASEIRQKEKQKNADTVRDAKEAQEAVAQALQVLKEFYAKAGAATSFLQTKTTEAVPETFSEPYTGMGGESGGVLGMMEVIASDFARLQAETQAAEEAAKAEYEEFMEDSKVDKATKSKTAEHKESKKLSKSQELMATETDLQGTQKELDAANAYLEKLKPDCLDTGASYAERKAQREEELKDLETALKMLETV
ncbi:unnamed protein product [Cladocopium goreaui]|uniref:Uncharacterized protein n=1 Tax=Cladocopium goreaui TaxID=2562237 RepID=A0A9P1D5W0_9DINO|nr:unnamed protein product [Cladocopium goreaui]CAI4003845.1 unnamed protein product [Cladocopium goreaui]